MWNWLFKEQKKKDYTTLRLIKITHIDYHVYKTERYGWIDWVCFRGTDFSLGKMFSIQKNVNLKHESYFQNKPMYANNKVLDLLRS